MSLFSLSRALDSEAKSLQPHPAFMDSSRTVQEYQVGRPQPRKDSLISQKGAPRWMGAYGGDQAIDWVYDAINLYADGAALADYKLQNPDGTRLVRFSTPSTPKDYKVGPKDLYTLLDQPNPFMLYDEMIALLVIDLLLVGNGYWYKWRTNAQNQPLALYRLAPSHVKVKPGPYGPLRYEYQPPGVAEKLILQPADILHFKRPNPLNNWYGMGVIQGGGRSMDLELSVTDTIVNYYDNRADPSLIIQSDRRVPRDVFRKLRAQLRARSAGSTNAGEMLVLESGLTATSLSHSAADALFKDLSSMSQYRVYAKFRAHPALFGVPGTTSGTDKVADIRAEFDNSTLRPFLKKLSTQITKSLTEAWGVEYLIDHRSTLPAADAIAVANAIAVMPYVKVREVRRQLTQFGIDESTGDQKIDETLLNKPGPQMDANGNVVDPVTGKVVPGGSVNAADKNIGSEPGRPPKPSNTAAAGRGKPTGKGLNELLAELEAKAISTTPAPDNRITGEVRPPDTHQKARAADLTAIGGAMQGQLAAAALELERALLDHVEGKALKTSDLAGRIRNSPAWAVFRSKVQKIMRENLRQAASSAVMHSGLRPAADVSYDAIVDEVINRKGGLSGIVKTLKDRVIKQVMDSRKAGAERHDFNAVVQGVIKEWSDGSAATVGLTEAVHAYNEATLTVAELSGVDQVYVTDGDDHDQPCIDAHGQVWDIAKARENRIEHPNCRRAFLPVAPAAVA